MPRTAAPRIIPCDIRDKAKSQIDKTVQLETLKAVTEPTDWAHAIVIVKKPNNDIRICMDPRALNKCHQHHPNPNKNVLLSQIKGAKYFTVLDASSAFLQIPLSEENQKICTIATHLLVDTVSVTFRLDPRGIPKKY